MGHWTLAVTSFPKAKHKERTKERKICGIQETGGSHSWGSFG